MEHLSRREKLIKLADRLEAGWAFMEEYIEDDLANNSDDERRIEKAEKAAEQKLAKRKRESDAGMKRGVAQPMAERIDTQLPDGKRLQWAGGGGGGARNTLLWYRSLEQRRGPVTSVESSATGGGNAQKGYPLKHVVLCRTRSQSPLIHDHIIDNQSGKVLLQLVYCIFRC